MSDEPLAVAGRLLNQNEYESLESQVAAQHEALSLIHEALLAIADELKRVRRGESPPGALARY